MESRLPGHKKALWSYSDMFSIADKQVVCYYHSEDVFLGMHKHKFYEINIIIEGRGTHFLEEHSCEAEVGSVFVIPPGVSHGYRVKKPMVIFHILLSELFLSLYREQLKNLSGYALLFEIEPHLRGRFSKEIFLTLSEEERARIFAQLSDLEQTAKSSYESKEAFAGIQAFSVIGALCRSIAEKKRLKHTENLPAASLEIVYSLEYIHENLSEKINFPQLAKSYNMTYSTFWRQFKKVTKATPLAYQNRLRLDRAKNLLTNTDGTVSFIAAECGFYDSSHFIRFFETHTNMPPLAYRKKYTKHA